MSSWDLSAIIHTSEDGMLLPEANLNALGSLEKYIYIWMNHETVDFFLLTWNGWWSCRLVDQKEQMLHIIY